MASLRVLHARRHSFPAVGRYLRSALRQRSTVGLVDTMRVATWNMKQAVAPRKPLPDLWAWLEQRVDPGIVVLTEAKVPKVGPPAGWRVHYTPSGIDHKRRWGTVIAARDATLVPVTSVRSGSEEVPLSFPYPGALEIANVMVDGARWATIVGLYGLTIGRNGKSCGSGDYTVHRMLRGIAPLFGSELADRLIVAGDFNLWPHSVRNDMWETGLIDVVDHTADTRAPLEGCSGCYYNERCGHLWTHRNGNGPNSTVQQIDFVFASKQLVAQLSAVYGGSQAFADAWDVSDHAPVVAEFG